MERNRSRTRTVLPQQGDKALAGQLTRVASAMLLHCRGHTTTLPPRGATHLIKLASQEGTDRGIGCLRLLRQAHGALLETASGGKPREE